MTHPAVLVLTQQYLAPVWRGDFLAGINDYRASISNGAVACCPFGEQKGPSKLDPLTARSWLSGPRMRSPMSRKPRPSWRVLHVKPIPRNGATGVWQKSAKRSLASPTCSGRDSVDRTGVKYRHSPVSSGVPALYDANTSTKT